MTEELTAVDLDRHLVKRGVNHRYQATVDGYSIVYTTGNNRCATLLDERLLRLRAVTDAIDDAGAVRGVPLQSYQVPLLAAEFERLQNDIHRRVSRANGGKAGRGKTRSAAIATILEAFSELSADAPAGDILHWLENETCHCEFIDGQYVFSFVGYKDASFDRRATLKKISSERP